MDSKRKSESPNKYSNVLKKKRNVSPIKKKPFDAIKHCQKLCTDLRTNPKYQSCAFIFYQPVDPVHLQCPEYYNVIKYPMDLSTIQKKLDDGCYRDENDFASDVRIMIQNCFTFNGMNHPIAPMCTQFQAVFEERFSKILAAKEKSKITIFHKIDMKEKEIRTQIQCQELILSDLNMKLESLEEQRKEEAQKLQGKIEVPVKKVKKIKNAPKKAVEDQKKAKREESVEQQEQSTEKINSESEEDDSAPSMTYDELRKLSQEINSLQTESLMEVLNVIKKYEKDLSLDENGEVEIDFDTLKPITVRALEQLLIDQKKQKPSVALKRGKGKTVQVLDTKELSEQEKTLKTQLESLEDQLGIKKKQPLPVKPPTPVRSESSSSSGESSSSSSSSGSSSDSISSSAED